MMACSNKVISPTQSNVDQLTSTYPDVTLADLEKGRSIYAEKCNMCHGYYKPNEYSVEDWGKIVPVMVVKVNKKSKSEVIDREKEDQLLKYILSVK